MNYVQIYDTKFYHSLIKGLTALTCIVDKSSYNYTEKIPASTTIHVSLLSAYSVECTKLLFMFFFFFHSIHNNNAMWHGLLFLIKSQKICIVLNTEQKNGVTKRLSNLLWNSTSVILLPHHSIPLCSFWRIIKNTNMICS